MKTRLRKGGTGRMIDRGWHPVQVWFTKKEFRKLRHIAHREGRTVAGLLREINLKCLDQYGYRRKPWEPCGQVTEVTG